MAPNPETLLCFQLGPITATAGSVTRRYNLLLPPGWDVRSVLPDGHVISSRYAGRSGSGWIDLPCAVQSVCQRHALTLAPRRVSPVRGRHDHFQHWLANLYTRWSVAIIATSRNPTLLVSYLESYLNDLQRWLSEWGIAINVSKCTAIMFARAVRRFNQPRPVTLFGEPIEWVDTTRYLGLNLDKRLTWSPHIDQVRKKTAQRMGVLGSPRE